MGELESSIADIGESILLTVKGVKRSEIGRSMRLTT